MITLTTFSNEMEAELLASQLKESDIDYKIEKSPTGDEFNVLIFEDDMEEAQEILEAKAMDEENMFGSDMSDLDDLDDLDLDDLDDV